MLLAVRRALPLLPLRRGGGPCAARALSSVAAGGEDRQEEEKEEEEERRRLQRVHAALENLADVDGAQTAAFRRQAVRMNPPPPPPPARFYDVEEEEEEEGEEAGQAAEEMYLQLATEEERQYATMDNAAADAVLKEEILRMLQAQEEGRQGSVEEEGTPRERAERDWEGFVRQELTQARARRALVGQGRRNAAEPHDDDHFDDGDGAYEPPLPLAKPGDLPPSWEEVMMLDGPEETYNAAERRISHMQERIKQLAPEYKPLEPHTPQLKAPLGTRKPLRRKVDIYGRAHGVGSRKTSRAHVWIWRGSGQISVNNKSLTQYFPSTEHRHIVISPFRKLRLAGQFDTYIQVKGGGSSGQAQAVRHGIAKALIAFDPRNFNWLGQKLRKKDPRTVERKKPGQPKARKKQQWVRR